MKILSTKKKIGLIILTVILTALLAVGAVALYLFTMHKPDNGSDDEVVFDTEGLLDETDAPATGSETGEAETQPPEEEKDEMYNFLILGKDQVALNTDVIMLMNFNVSTKKMTIMQIPRDTYVLINHYGFKLNSVYGHYYNEAAANNKKDPEKYGADQLRQLLQDKLCLKIHYYVTVNLEGFRNIVDILGGIEIDIPADMTYYDESQGLTINLRKGKQTLDGKGAEGFVRFRSGYVQADIGRMDAQKIFMSALLKKVTEELDVVTVVKLAGEVFKNIDTDVGVDDMAYFAKHLLKFDMSDMRFLSAPGYSPMPPEGYVWYYVINREGTRGLINKYYNIYDFEITDGIFDKDRVFSGNLYATYLTPYYNGDPADMLGGEEHSAGDINNDGLDIPRT